MVEKLKLSEFLTGLSKPIDSPLPICKAEIELTYPLLEFYKKMIEHSGGFIIEDTYFANLIPTNNNLYFFNEDFDDEYMIVFDPIIDIKEKNNIFTLFYYPETTISIKLKEPDGKES